jgi:hypothetical protein
MKNEKGKREKNLKNGGILHSIAMVFVPVKNFTEGCTGPYQCRLREENFKSACTFSVLSSVNEVRFLDLVLN